MTREEALYWLDTIPTIGEQVDALEMAIQALSQEPCDDVVSRQAVIKLFNGNIGSESALILHKVKQLPSVTQKPIERDDAISREAVCNIVNDIRNYISVEGYWAILERLK